MLLHACSLLTRFSGIYMFRILTLYSRVFLVWLPFYYLLFLLLVLDLIPQDRNWCQLAAYEIYLKQTINRYK